VPAIGKPFTVIERNAVAVPQLVILYEIVVTPAATPVTLPEPSTVAIVTSADVHVPPAVVSANASATATHTTESPVIDPATAGGVTRILIGVPALTYDPLVTYNVPV
jgi:hypothetical protein